MSSNADNHNDSSDEQWISKFFRLCRESYLVRPDNRWVGGVCGAIAQRMGWSTALVRALMLLSVFLFGAGAAFYGFAWFVLPDSGDSIIAEDILDGRWHGSLVGIIICWLLAAWALGIGVPSIIIAALVLYFFIKWSRRQARTYFSTVRSGDPGSYGGPGYSSGPQGFGPYQYTNPGSQGSTSHGPGFYGFGSTGSGSSDMYPPTSPAQGGGRQYPNPSSTNMSDQVAPDSISQNSWVNDQHKGPVTSPNYVWGGLRGGGQPGYVYPPKPFPTPRPIRLRRRPAGPGLVCLMLGLILLSGGVVWLLASMSNKILYYMLVWAAAVAIVLGIVIILLGCMGRRSGGLTPIAIMAVIVVIALSVYTGNLAFTLRNDVQSYTSIKVSGRDQGRRLGSTREDMQGYQRGLLLTGEPKDQGRAVIDLSEFEKNNGTHEVNMGDALSQVSGCPTGTLNLALHFADAQIILPKGCTYLYHFTGYGLIWGSDSNQNNRVTSDEEDQDMIDEDSPMPYSPELTISVRPAIGGRVSIHREGTATLPEGRATSSDELKHMDHDHNSDQDQDQDQEGEEDE